MANRKIMLGMLVLAVCFVLAGCVSSSATSESRGQVLQVELATKDFVTLGIIFVTSTETQDSSGSTIEGSKITFEMLMKEAQRLGADDIVNLRIDESRASSSFTGVTPVTYKATALAIKYVR